MNTRPRIRKSLVWLCVLVGYQTAVLADQPSHPNNRAAELVALIRGEPRTDEQYAAKVEAIKEAARHPSPDSALIRALIDNFFFLTKEARRMPERDPMLEQKDSFQPARDALLEIGKPAIPFLVEELKETADVKRRSSLALFLRGVAGADTEGLLEEAIQKTDDSTRQNRLVDCLRRIEATGITPGPARDD